MRNLAAFVLVFFACLFQDAAFAPGEARLPLLLDLLQDFVDLLVGCSASFIGFMNAKFGLELDA